MARRQRQRERHAPVQRPGAKASITDVGHGNAANAEAVSGDLEAGGLSFLESASAQLGSGLPPGGDAGAPPDELPHRARLEGALGVDLSDVPVVQGGDLAGTGARAAATAEGIVLGDDTSIEVVAEEVVHWLQLQGTGGLGGTSDPADPAEVEARAIAEQIATGQTPDALLQRATSRVMRNADGLTASERTRLRDLAATAAADLYRELDSTWTVDSTLRGRVHEYRTAVRGIRREGWFMDQALRILDRAYRQLARSGLVHDVRGSTSGDDRDVLVSQLTVRNIDPPAPSEDAQRADEAGESTASSQGEGQETTAGTDGPADAGPSDRLSRAELRLARQLADRCIATIRGELRATVWTEDANVLAGLRQWNAAVLEVLDRASPAPTGSDRRGKIRQAQGLLRDRYAHQVRHRLQTDIENGLQLASRTEGLRLIGRSGGSAGADEEQAEPENPRARARLACWPHCQTLETEIQELTNATFTSIDVGQIDAAYDAAIAACGSSGVTEAQDKRAIVRATYREVSGSDLVAHLEAACGGNTSLAADLGRRLGLTLSVAQDDADAEPSAPPPGQGFGTILQALNGLFRATWTDEAAVQTRCSELAAWARAAAGDRDAATLSQWTADRDRHLQEATDDYGRRFGTGLSDEIRAHVWDSAVQRRCLDAIGDRGAVSDQVASAAVAEEGGGETADALLAATDELTEALTPIARALRDELDDVFVDGGIVRQQCHTFYTTWQRLQSDARFGDRMQTPVFARNILMQLYADMGGSLVDDINGNVSDHDDKDASFRSLGLGYTNLAVSLEEQGAAGSTDVSDLDTEDRLSIVLRGPLNTMFMTVRGAVDARNPRGGGYQAPIASYIQRIGEDWQATLRVARSHHREGAEGSRAVQTAYWELHGIELREHLSLACRTQREADQLSEATGGIAVRPAALGRASDQGEQSEDVLVYGETRERVNDEGELEAFDEDDAYAQARDLYRAIDDRDRAAVSRILTHDRPAGERQAIINMFNETYPVTVRFFMRQRFGAEGADIQLLEAASSQSGRFDPTQELRHMVAARDESIYRRVMDLSADEKRAVLADSSLMADIRDAFGQDGYERVRNTLTGHLGVDDMMRTRDTETFWGMGTDERGFEQDLSAYVSMRRREILPGIIREGRADGKTGDALRTWTEAEVRRRLEPELIRMSSTPEAVDTVFSDLGGEDYLQAMMRLDTTTGELDHAQAAQADPTGPQLLTHLRALNAGQRTRLLEDTDFVVQLRENDTATHLQAMAILRGDAGMADVEAGLDNLDTDETQVFRGLTEGDADRMRSIARDEALRNRITNDLDGEASDTLDEDANSERALFEEMMGDFEALDDAPEASDLPARRARKTTELVIRHKFRILAGVQDDTDALLEAAQAAYNERGSFKATSEATEEFLFDIRDGTHGQAARAARRRIEDEVMSRVTAVHGAVAAGNLSHIVRGAIRMTQDPARERLGRALAYQTDEDGVANTLENVSDRTLALHWSNIRVTGRRGGTFAGVVAPWLDADRPDSGQIWSRMMDFRLGMSEGVDQRLRDDFMVGDSELDSWRSTLQRRILALPWSEVKAALRAGGCEGLTDADEDILIGQDRQARSRVRHREDRFAQSREDGSAIDGLADSDDAVDRAYMQLHGEFEADVADDGRLSPEELERIRAVEGYVDNAEAEYREAKSNAATYATGVAAAVIAVVGTIVSGPGGPSLAATLMTAATQAAVTTALDEAIQGRDFDAVETGLRRIATECATAGLTHGLGSLFGQAVQRIPGAGDLLARAGAWRQGLSQASRTSRNALLRHALVSGAIAGAEGLRDNAVEAIVELIDDLFTDGWDRATQNINLGGAVESWSLEYLRTFVSAAATSYSDEEIRRIFADHIEAGGARGAIANLGQDVAQQGGRTVAGGLGNAAEDVVTDRPMRAFDRDTYETDGLGTFAAGAARRTTSRLAGDERDRRNSALADELMQRPDIARGVGGLPRPAGMTEAQVRRMYRARILAEGAPSEEDLGGDLTRFREGPMARIERGIERQTRDRNLTPEQHADFVEWVVGESGRGAEGRLSGPMGFEAYQRAQAAPSAPVEPAAAAEPAPPSE